MILYFTDPALEHLENIYCFIENKSEKAANKTYNTILDKIDRLKVFPQMAPVEPLLAGAIYILIAL
jgi:plasmid stabilization system protein ParE